jgi:glycerol-3-phosphate dehydrogenase
MRPRDPGRVSSDTYDLLVVGGGIHGLTIAYEAAARGLRTAQVVAGDFGSAASFNHQKTAHGGLRALQALRIRRAREAVRERRTLARIAPWLLRPLPFIIGTYRSVLRNRLALRAAFKLDAWIGRDRNEGVEPELHLPAARLVSKAATLRLFPGVHPEKLTGGAQWYDYQMVESDRLTLAFAAAADRAGADLANYVEAVAAIRDGNRIGGMTVRDRLTGAQLEIRARVVVNAAGSMAGTVMRMLGVARPLPLLKAMNLVTSKRASDIALAAPASDGRMLTLVPWHGRAIVGTSQSASLVEPGDAGVTRAEVEAFIAQANEAFPALKLSIADVTLVHRGVVPAASREGRAELLGETPIFDHGGEGADGALTVPGTKFTTARSTAAKVVARVARKLGRRLTRSRTGSTTLPGAGIADHEALVIETARGFGMELPLPVIRHLTAKYGELAAEIVRLMGTEARLREPLAADRPSVAAEVVYVVRSEMAVHLSDIVIRRLGLGAAGHPGPEVLAAAAAVAAAELGWDDAALRAEIAEVDRFYAIPD